MSNDGIELKPSMIDTVEHWWNAFDNCETEVSAKLFTRACAKKGEWEVTQEELNAEDSKGTFRFNWLLDVDGRSGRSGRWPTEKDENGLVYSKWIVEVEPGVFRPTEDFIRKAVQFVKLRV